jgi:hypothetical protein
MPAWGDTKKRTPQQIADVIAYVMSLNPAPAATPTTPVTPTEAITPTAEVTPTVDVARPSNPGGPGGAQRIGRGDRSPHTAAQQQIAIEISRSRSNPAKDRGEATQRRGGPVELPAR